MGDHCRLLTAAHQTAAKAMAAAAAWRAARHKTATSLLAAAPTERFEAFVRKWAETDDEPYAAR